MCGIVGFVSSAIQEESLQATLDPMIASLHHRGPDASGSWFDRERGVAIGHRRLSVLDCSEAAAQPMISNSGRYIFSYNGEIYNFREIHAELLNRGHSFRGTGDTEVVLAAFEEWGVEHTLPRLNGMFAFAVWDTQQRRLVLARDRLGIKPLYCGWSEQGFLFSSELRVCEHFPGFGGELNQAAITSVIALGHVPAPATIYQHFYKLLPGSYVSLDEKQLHNIPSEFSPQRYWSALEVAQNGIATPFLGTTSEAVEQLDALIKDSVRLRMISDVPLGAFLSGGIDSSLVVSLMQNIGASRVKTFSIGFEETEYNEAGFAKAVAQHLETDHTELYFSAAEAAKLVPKMPEIYDEPFADSSQLPTFLVSRLARQHVTVSLSGDGGDELFGGYPRFLKAPKIWSSIAWVPQLIRKLCGQPLRPSNVRQLHQIGEVLCSQGLPGIYNMYRSEWVRLHKLFLNPEEQAFPLVKHEAWRELSDHYSQMLYLDLVTYLPDDILTKVDRASMAVSLEARVPLLDHRVVEFAWRFPASERVTIDGGKSLLKKVLAQYVPRELTDRPKMGFGVPIGAWLKTHLRDWAEDLLDSNRIAQDGIFDPTFVQSAWQLHLASSEHRQNFLWNLLMFQAWLRERQTR